MEIEDQLGVVSSEEKNPRTLQECAKDTADKLHSIVSEIIALEIVKDVILPTVGSGADIE